MIKAVVHTTKKGIEINVVVLPKSAQAGVVGIHNNCLKVKLTKPPVDGQANAECCKIVSKFLGIAKSCVSVIQGKTSRTKILLVDGISEKKVKAQLLL